MRKLRQNVFDILKSVIRGYWADDCHHFAAVISFYAIFSMLPLAMIAVAALAHFLGSSEDIIARFQAMFESVMPTAADELFRLFHTALEGKQKVSLIGAAFLVLLASFMVSAMESALDRVFRSENKRNFLHSRAVAIGFIFVFTLLFAAPGLVRLIQVSFVNLGFLQPTEVWAMSGDVFFFFVAFMAFLLMVTVIPNRKVYVRYAFFGAMTFTVLTGVARLFFRMYITATWSRYNLIYDSLTVLIVLIVWIYYMANIFLGCAELVARLQERRLNRHA